ncbi:hypothetical protein PYCC9005_005702 [Savitreella phatthalungensis]
MRHDRSITSRLVALLGLINCVNAQPVDTKLLLPRRLAEGLSPAQIVGYVIAILMLVAVSGVTAGLTLGLMSLDETQLHVLAQSGTAEQKRHATKILPIRRKGHLLLVSLLLMNVVVNETLPILSERLFSSGPVSIVLSTVMIVIFSEIIPQAVCSTHGLRIGAAMAIPVRGLILLLYVISWPIAKLLDLMLGETHGMIYRRAELKELIDFHSQQAAHGGDLNIDAVTIMRGALDLQEKRVRDSMTSIENVFMLPHDAKLDRETMSSIAERGHSRIPIYQTVRGDMRITGCLLAKNLLLVDPDDELPLRHININHIPSVQDDLPLFDILNIFQEGRSHLAVVVPSPSPEPPVEVARTRTTDSRSSNETVLEERSVPTRLWTEAEMAELDPIGVITLEDVLEELIQEPIWDETDQTPRPRAGLAIPLSGTGESLILATSHGRGRGRDRAVSKPIELDTLVDPFASPEDAKLINKHLTNVSRPLTSDFGLSSPSVGPTRPPSSSRFKSVSNRSSVTPIGRRARSESAHIHTSGKQ